jgi:tripartite-type tricarboxylate transporter receptor subunit TctC
MTRWTKLVVFCAVTVVMCAAPTHAQSQAPARANFYAGRTINIMVGSTPGGYYDIAGRVVARHFNQFLPGKPNIVVQNQPGAGGVAIVNKLAHTLPRDGATIVIMSRALPQLALTGDPNADFDPLTFSWLGSLSSYKDDGYLMTINASSPVMSLADIRPSGKAIHLGGTRTGSTNITFALMARDLIKLNIDLVRGFPGASEIWLAMERGELDGQFLDLSAIMVGRPTLWAEKKLRPLLAFGRTERFPDMPDVPVARELIADPNDLALLEFAELPFFMATPFAAPPDIPADRTKTLRESFMAMATNEEFRADMKKAGILTSPIDGKAVHDLIEKAAKTPLAVRQRFGQLLVDK